ncbi:hypothetical protein DFH06DRAFT_1227970 [Mycena polygramma]|nr:hypothetical protein DFH06DRAFT_1227970 [Mycena polygramma]
MLNLKFSVLLAFTLVAATVASPVGRERATPEAVPDSVDRNNKSWGNRATHENHPHSNHPDSVDYKNGVNKNWGGRAIATPEALPDSVDYKNGVNKNWGGRAIATPEVLPDSVAPKAKDSV